MGIYTLRLYSRAGSAALQPNWLTFQAATQKDAIVRAEAEIPPAFIPQNYFAALWEETTLIWEAGTRM